MSATRKGKLLEVIAAKLHAAPGVKVETRVLLPPHLDEAGRRKREIDVLLTASVAGHRVRMAIECKNESKPIEAGYIDAFAGKLQYVGIPAQHGIFVSRSRYTKGAQERAKAAGITLLNVAGLTKDGLAAAIFRAFQSVVYLLLEVTELSLINSSASSKDSPLFYNEAGQYQGTLFDLVWRMWRDDNVPTTIGEHSLEVEIPEGWYQFVDGKPDPLVSLTAQVRVVGLIITIQGSATQHALWNAMDQSFDRGRIDVDFQAPDSHVSLTPVLSEDDLRPQLDQLSAGGVVRMVVGRIRLPRIRAFGVFGNVYWPPSERALSKMKDLAEKNGVTSAPGDSSSTEPFDPDQLEGTDFHTIWEPIWKDYKLPP